LTLAPENHRAGRVTDDPGNRTFGDVLSDDRGNKKEEREERRSYAPEAVKLYDIHGGDISKIATKRQVICNVIFTKE